MQFGKCLLHDWKDGPCSLFTCPGLPPLHCSTARIQTFWLFPKTIMYVIRFCFTMSMVKAWARTRIIIGQLTVRSIAIHNISKLFCTNFAVKILLKWHMGKYSNINQFLSHLQHLQIHQHAQEVLVNVVPKACYVFNTWARFLDLDLRSQDLFIQIKLLWFLFCKLGLSQSGIFQKGQFILISTSMGLAVLNPGFNILIRTNNARKLFFFCSATDSYFLQTHSQVRSAALHRIGFGIWGSVPMPSYSNTYKWFKDWAKLWALLWSVTCSCKINSMMNFHFI